MATVTTSDNNENKDKPVDLTPVVEVKPAVKPDSLSEKQAQDIKAQAAKAVTTLVNAKGSEVLSISDSITNVGIKDQKIVSNNMALLQERMGNVFFSDNKTAVTDELTENMASLQGVLAKINPKDIQKESIYRWLKFIPFFGNWLVRTLKVSAERSTTLQGFIEHLEESLKSGETMLKQDNVQLQVMYQNIEEQQKTIRADAYFAEALMEQLSEAIAGITDEKQRGELNKVLFQVSTRAQDLRVMENAHEQFFASITMTRDNNKMLISSVNRMLTLGMNLFYLAFAINSALTRQKKVLEAEKGTRNLLGTLMVNNAEMIHQNAKEIGDVYTQPVIALDKMQKAVDLLIQAMNETNQLKSSGIEQAQQNITRIKVMTEDIKTKASSLPDGAVASLEASKTLELPVGVTKAQ